GLRSGYSSRAFGPGLVVLWGSARRVEVISPIGLVRPAVELWVELVQDRADDPGADRFQLLFRPADLFPIGASGPDHQKDAIHHAAEEHRVIDRQDRRGIQENDAISL